MTEYDKQQEITDRLYNPKNYTGVYRERFLGAGKGNAKINSYHGKEDVAHYTGHSWQTHGSKYDDLSEIVSRGNGGSRKRVQRTFDYQTGKWTYAKGADDRFIDELAEERELEKLRRSIDVMIRCDDAGLLDDLISNGVLEPSVELCQDLMRRHGCIHLPERPHFNKVRRQGYKDDQVHGSPTNNEEHNPQPFQFGHKAPANSRCLQWLCDHEKYRDVYEEAVELYMEQEAREHEIETILEQQKELDSLDTTNVRSNLYIIFCYYCAFGRTSSHGTGEKTLDNQNFSKFCREIGVVRDKLNPHNKLTMAQVDVIFSECKTKALRRLTFPQFLDCLAIMATKTFPRVPVVVAFSRLLVEHVFRLEEGNPIDIDRFVDRHEAHKNRLAMERQQQSEMKVKVSTAVAAAPRAGGAVASAAKASAASTGESIPAGPPPPPAVAAQQLAEKREASRRSRFAGIGATF